LKQSIEVKGELLEQVGDFTFALIASWFGYGFIGDHADHCEHILIPYLLEKEL
jgi:hypothetical protein